ncbi:molecular chaperone [Burkholderia sp. BCC1977]|uniref:fimbrial biogenesis chaperone n=1 Tax=Burkholderia sp. BCC1977 TaxID=2817440 RepID=UPI002ABE500C|nr:molecular chaperone [Burkholderia sp. BCC1977]
MGVRIAMPVLAAVLGVQAHASTLQISPVMVELHADQPAAGVSLRNTGDKPLYGQVRVFAWTQTSAGDVLVPTQGVVASPPIVQIAPNADQLVRLVRAAPGPVPAEQSYRLLIDEIPPADAAPANGVQVRLRYSVPVFVGSAVPNVQPQLDWHLEKHDDAWFLRVENHGARHAQIGALTLRNAAGESYAVSGGLFGYALAGTRREWRLPLKGGADLAGAITIVARINGQPVTANVAHD